MELTAAIVRILHLFACTGSSWGRRQGAVQATGAGGSNFTAIIGFSKHILTLSCKIILILYYKCFCNLCKAVCKETPPPPQRHPAAGGTLARPTCGASVLNTVCSCGSAQSSSRTSRGKRTACSRRLMAKHPHRHPALQQTAAAGPIRRIPAGSSPDRCRIAPPCRQGLRTPRTRL